MTIYLNEKVRIFTYYPNQLETPKKMYEAQRKAPAGKANRNSEKNSQGASAL